VLPWFPHALFAWVQERKTKTLKQLLEAGVHFGHQTRRWNPKMKPLKTYEQLEAAYSFVRDASKEGKTEIQDY